MLDKDDWRPISFLCGLYEVSATGGIRSLYRRDKRREVPFVLKPWNSGGYPTFSAAVNGKRHNTFVHTAILWAFVGPPPKGHEAAHLDGIRSNSVLSNLKWATRKENAAHRFIHGTAFTGERGTRAKLSKKQLLEILRRVKGGMSIPQAVVGTPVSAQAIYDIREGKRWKHFIDIQQIRKELWPEKGRKWSKNRPANLAHTTKFGLHFARRGVRRANRPSA